MPSMKPQTMIWSFLLSRWKHMVTTSLSAAALHMGRDCDRQKALLHWLHVGEACARLDGGAAAASGRRRRDLGCRGRRWSLVLGWGKRIAFMSSSASSASASRKDRRGLEESGVVVGSSSSSWSSVLSTSEGALRWDVVDPRDDLGVISIIVLLVKHVHLQNVGAAEERVEN